MGYFLYMDTMTCMIAGLILAEGANVTSTSLQLKCLCDFVAHRSCKFENGSGPHKNLLAFLVSETTFGLTRVGTFLTSRTCMCFPCADFTVGFSHPEDI